MTMLAEHVKARCTAIGGVRVMRITKVPTGNGPMLVFHLENGKRYETRPGSPVDTARTIRRELDAGPVRPPTRDELIADVRAGQTPRGSHIRGLATRRLRGA